MANSQPLDMLETKLNDVFGRQAPPLPENARRVIVKYAPWASIILGILSLGGALTLWRWAHVATDLIDYSNHYMSMYGGAPSVSSNHMSVWVWVGLLVLAVEGVLYLLAYPGLRDQTKAGWNYLYWGALLNLAYIVVGLFTEYGFSNFIGSAIGSAFGFWLLFQVRSFYVQHAVSAQPKSQSHTNAAAKKIAAHPTDESDDTTKKL